jgi:hypothetical protein
LFHLQCNHVPFHTNSVTSSNIVRIHSFSTSTVSPRTWHSQLGHLSDDRLKLLSSQNSHISFDSNKCCLTCPLAKQHCLPFPISNSVSSHPFDIVHCDIWGHFSTASFTGTK